MLDFTCVSAKPKKTKSTNWSKSTIWPTIIPPSEYALVQKHDASGFLKTSYDIDLANTPFAQVMSRLPPMAESGPWLAGGAIRRTLMMEEPDGDFDIFFADMDQYKWFCKELKKADFSMVKENKNYRQYQGKVLGKVRDIQCVKSVFFNQPTQVVGSFDFTICMFGFDGSHIYVGPNSIDDLDKRVIQCNIVNDSRKSATRILKYAKQGFMPTKEALIKLNDHYESLKNEDNY